MDSLKLKIPLLAIASITSVVSLLILITTSFVSPKAKLISSIKEAKYYSSPFSSGGGISSGISWNQNRSHVLYLELVGMIKNDERSKGLLAAMDKAIKNPKTKAVIIDIDSGGGAAATSELLYRKIMELRKKKVVVAIVSGMAASGAYYIASACPQIYSISTSIVGSIGVYSMFPNITNFLAKHGLSVNIIKSGKLKGGTMPFSPMSGEVRDILQGVSEEIYSTFIKDVAKGRGKKPAYVRNRWADARIFTASQALRIGMIDGIGHKAEAIAYITKKLKLKNPLPLVKPEKNFMDFFKENFKSMAQTIFIKSLSSMFYDPQAVPLGDALNTAPLYQSKLEQNSVLSDRRTIQVPLLLAPDFSFQAK